MSIVVDKELEQLKEYEKDFQYFKDNYDEIYKNHKNESVAIKNKKIYHHKDIGKLLQILKDNNIEPAHTFIQFIRDKEIEFL